MSMVGKTFLNAERKAAEKLSKMHQNSIIYHSKNAHKFYKMLVKIHKNPKGDS